MQRIHGGILNMHLFSPVHHPRSVRFLSPGARAAKGSNYSRLLLLIPALTLVLACGDQGSPVGVDPEPAASSGHVTLGHDFLPPPEDYALFGQAGAFLTPHTAARVPQAMANMSRVVEDIVAMLQGRQPKFPAQEGAF